MMTLRGIRAFVLIAALWGFAVPLQAATPRQMLIEAAFQARDKAAALAQIGEAEKGAIAGGTAGNRDAALVRAMAIGYRAKLMRSRGDAMAARAAFEALAASDPRDAEAVAALGTWHLDSVIELGGFAAGLAIGAKKATGLRLMDRAVLLGGNRATYPGLGALLRLAIDPDDPQGRLLAEKASAAAAPQPLDRIMQRSAIAVLAALRTGDQKGAQKLARQLLPFGRLQR